MLAETLIRSIPDFPQPGILFRDITPVLHSPAAMREVVGEMADYAESRGADVIACVESRGFVFGSPVAMQVRLPIVPVRKIGKLPWETVRCEYALEYGTAAMEMHRDALQPGQRVVIVDDLLATGGTAAAAVRLSRDLGAEVVGLTFLIELLPLNGRDQLVGLDVHSLIQF